MRKYIILLGIGIVAVVFVALFVFERRPLTKPDKVHYHAGFIVYKDGKRDDFSDFKYMHIEPCGEKHGESSAQDEQLEKAHLHDGVGDVVHVHRKGATWRDLFKNINYPIDLSNVKAYVNGEPVSDIVTREIVTYDSLLFVIGDETGVDKTLRFDRDYILDVEKKSEFCGEQAL